MKASTRARVLIGIVTATLIAAVLLVLQSSSVYGARSRQNTSAEKESALQAIPVRGCGALNILMLRGYFDPGEIYGQLASHPEVQSVDLFNVYTGTPTLLQISAYDMVVTIMSGNYQDRATLGNVLADYVDQGGVVVQTGADWYPPYYLQGRWDTGGYSPLTYPIDAQMRADYIGTHNPTHPLMQGVVTQGVGMLVSYFRAPNTVAVGATQVAQYHDTLFPLIAFKGRVVAINAYIAESKAHGQWDGNYDRVMVNAANWLKTRTSGATATPAPPSPTPLPPTATPTPCSGFCDLPPDHTFYPFIMCMANRGIISGYADNTFRPGNNVTRGQLSKIVSNSAGYNDPPGEQMFTDVAPSSTFYDWVQRLASRGYIGGYECGTVGEPCDGERRPYFRPNNNATRGQISKIVSNTAGYADPPGAQIFEDVLPGSTFHEWIQRLASRGIMGGYQCGGAGEPCLSGKPYFRPNNNATRGQTSKIVANTFFPECQP